MNKELCIKVGKWNKFKYDYLIVYTQSFLKYKVFDLSFNFNGMTNKSQD
jgi:hypothetical protein